MAIITKGDPRMRAIENDLAIQQEINIYEIIKNAVETKVSPRAWTVRVVYQSNEGLKEDRIAIISLKELEFDGEGNLLGYKAGMYEKKPDFFPSEVVEIHWRRSCIYKKC